MTVPETPARDVAVTAPRPNLALDPAAALCTDIARAETAAALDALVDRAAGMLGAAGIVIWLKGSQDELVPAVVHGYGPEAHARIGSLPLSDANLTTRAWHSGVLQSAAGDGRGRAALAAPLFQGAQPTGVFAVELASGSDVAAPRFARSRASWRRSSRVPWPRGSSRTRPAIHRSRRPRRSEAALTRLRG